jgi:hypothetical protein
VAPAAIDANIAFLLKMSVMTKAPVISGGVNFRALG